uniref:Uncharacterized protein n=1 Tax=Lepeophtheirus salmonis TaxID=72036 RepID=A0A0K2TGY2_LEPSM
MIDDVCALLDSSSSASEMSTRGSLLRAASFRSISSRSVVIMGIFLCAGSGGGGSGSFQQKEKNMKTKITPT